ncbi:MAG: 4Fe-4S binding protein [Clostridiales Family XIII bacterium]|nr:4Fe-4S binding protein [Clostridiales Family XIII bacterium]
MGKISLNTGYCKSCGLCIRACTRGALSISGKTNEKGYRVIAADDMKCVGCGLCYTVCPDYVFTIEDQTGSEWTV